MNKLRRTGRYYLYRIEVAQRWRSKVYPWYTDSIVARTAAEASRLYAAKIGRKWDQAKFKVEFHRGVVARKGDV